jgi:hypothetical protein
MVDIISGFLSSFDTDLVFALEFALMDSIDSDLIFWIFSPVRLRSLYEYAS